MKQVRFLSPAEAEMVTAAAYYESQCANLGRRFLNQVRHTVHAITTHPLAGATLRGSVRRRLVDRFPFAVLYCVTDEDILIVAIMDLRRDPEYWLDRL